MSHVQYAFVSWFYCVLIGCFHGSYVVEPYHKYPNLLDILFGFLKTEQTTGIRREVSGETGLEPGT